MSKRKKVIEKGYNVEVVSWENDGDNYRTHSGVYFTKEEALAVKHMCENLFRSSNNGEGGIGCFMDYEDDEAILVIAEYLTRNPTLLEINKEAPLSSFKERVELEYSYELRKGEVTWEDCLYEYLENESCVPDEWISMVNIYKYDLMGGSEYYYSRVCEKVTISYSPTDIYLDIVEG